MLHTTGQQAFVDPPLKPSPENYKIVFAMLIVLTCASFVPVVAAGRPSKQRAISSRARQRAIVVDERLAALRSEPHLAALLVQRLGRGREVVITGSKRAAADGVVFHRVSVSRRRSGWIQAESLVAPARVGDDERLWSLIRSSEEFDQLMRASLFAEFFTKSALRPAVLMLLGETAESAAANLSRDAARRLNANEMTAGGAPMHSYFMNYAGLDRYNRIGVAFVYDRTTKQFHYGGASWREIVRRYPQSPEAAEARRRLAATAAIVSK